MYTSVEKVSRIIKLQGNEKGRDRPSGLAPLHPHRRTEIDWCVGNSYEQANDKQCQYLNSLSFKNSFTLPWKP